MARTVKEASLDTRTARARLPIRHKPYWRNIDQGCHVGYYKGRRSASWVARYFLGQGRYAETKLGTADDVQDADGIAILSFSQAQERARSWFGVQARSAAGMPEHGGPYTIADAIHDYLLDLDARGAKSIVDAKSRARALILPTLGQVDVTKFTRKTIRDWFVSLARSPARVRTRKGSPQRYKVRENSPENTRRRRATANRTLTVLKAALNHAWHEDRIPSDEAWRSVRPFREADASKVRYLSGDERTRLVNACEPDFRPLVQAALLTGARYGELTALRCADLDLGARTVSVRASKSGKPRHVPLNEEGVEFFQQVTMGRPGEEIMFQHPDGRSWGPSHQRRPLEAAAQASKVTNVSFHVLRHSYASTLAMAGVPMAVIAAVLGHADTRVTEKHYAHLAPSYIAETIRASLPPMGIVETSNVAILGPQIARTQAEHGERAMVSYPSSALKSQ